MKSLIKLKATGRGRNYSRVRGVVESAQALLFARGWPGRLRDAWGRHRIDVVRHHVPAARGRRAPLRIAFASDLHIGPLTPPGLLEAAFDRLAALEPDVLVLGGDYVFLDVTAPAADALARLVARVPAAVKIAVLGNHDLWTDHAVIEAALARGGARVLVNDALRLPPPHDDVAFVGLDDPWAGRPDPDRAFAGAGGAELCVAVVHAPEGYPLVRGRGARVMLCGHTHGGQIATPRGPIVVYGEVGRRFPAGRYDLEDLMLYVSRGLGAVDFPLRTFASPDVALVSLG
jgi:predicted MPP superfamily phosphohydrolase